jgi:polyisoprenoid-binding protein YceI
MYKYSSWLVLLLAIVGAGCALNSPDGRAAFPTRRLSSNASVPAPNAPGPRPPNATATALLMSPENTSIRFVGASLMNRQSGSFTRFGGQLELASNDPRDARLSIEIEMDSVSTEIPLLTKHLKRPDFFDVEHFPKATFVSSRIEASKHEGATHSIIGNLTVHGITRTLAIPARFAVSADLVAIDAAFELRQSEFGMARAARKTGDIVPVTLSARLARR